MSEPTDECEAWWARPEHADLREYLAAVAGGGPLAAQWEDKPHRLVYDLCLMVVLGRQRVAELESERDRLRGLIGNLPPWVADLEAERDRLSRVLAALHGIGWRGLDEIEAARAHERGEADRIGRLKADVEVARLRSLIMEALGNGTDEQAWPPGVDYREALLALRRGAIGSGGSRDAA